MAGELDPQLHDGHRRPRYRCVISHRHPVARKPLVLIIAAAIFAAANAPDVAAEKPSDDQIKQEIIRKSIASYPGVCACPYSTMRNGRRCGGRSAYSRPGGRSPLCYPSDVTPEMVERYKKQQR